VGCFYPASILTAPRVAPLILTRFAFFKDLFVLLNLALISHKLCLISLLYFLPYFGVFTSFLYHTLSYRYFLLFLFLFLKISELPGLPGRSRSQPFLVAA
jgi:hypothetical protein